MYVSREERNGLTKEYLNELFEYQDGKLYWKVSNSNRVKVGDEAGDLKPCGYIYVGINGHRYRLHRIIWLMHYGTLPKILDHIDLNRTNNRIENLRGASFRQNCCNQPLSKNNKSGFKNVSWSKPHEKWCVRIGINGFYKNIGYYEDLELAALVALEAREKYHGEFARHS